MFLSFFVCSILTVGLRFFVFSPDMRVLFWRVDQEGSHNTSMVASHVDHVVGLSVLHIPQVSSLGQDVVNLLLFSFWRDERRLFLWRLFEHRVERGVIIQHQPAFQPVTSLVAFVEGVLAHCDLLISRLTEQSFYRCFGPRWHW